MSAQIQPSVNYLGFYIIQAGRLPLLSASEGWLGSRVVSVLDSGAESPGSNRSRDAVG